MLDVEQRDIAEADVAACFEGIQTLREVSTGDNRVRRTYIRVDRGESEGQGMVYEEVAP